MNHQPLVKGFGVGASSHPFVSRLEGLGRADNVDNAAGNVRFTSKTVFGPKYSYMGIKDTDQFQMNFNNNITSSNTGPDIEQYKRERMGEVNRLVGHVIANVGSQWHNPTGGGNTGGSNPMHTGVGMENGFNLPVGDGLLGSSANSAHHTAMVRETGVDVYNSPSSQLNSKTLTPPTQPISYNQLHTSSEAQLMSGQGAGAQTPEHLSMSGISNLWNPVQSGDTTMESISREQRTQVLRYNEEVKNLQAGTSNAIEQEATSHLREVDSPVSGRLRSKRGKKPRQSPSKL